MQRLDCRRFLSFFIAEIFKIKDEKIRQIEAVLMAVPYGMESGWQESPGRGAGKGMACRRPSEDLCFTGFRASSSPNLP